MYYELSSASGNSEAQFNLAIFHLEGRGGLKQSAEKGRELLEKAAAGGAQAARAALGLDEEKEVWTSTGFNRRVIEKGRQFGL